MGGGYCEICACSVFGVIVLYMLVCSGVAYSVPLGDGGFAIRRESVLSVWGVIYCMYKLVRYVAVLQLTKYLCGVCWVWCGVVSIGV